ncbi:XrtA/PEP-CTERM system amidotransferase [Azospirillum canadense]|uniref:XrtA/PEP-CTERM system amidotransferase n=1 Tax=Azospirillum canadense TaxID=403962 RepID=UPI002226413D|nr:XrtA/PEP-CTERM system amidotransferase [Azospirillum canadense]MCW2240891.1 asparagine synthase (glutamine-hydrolyzing) [Azospirillum canadense]
MCGISGIVDVVGRRAIDQDRLARINGRLAHRGPDGEGFHHAPGIGLGHRRLAIIDLEGGKQPLYNETGDVVVVYNGELYNFASLRDELVRRGHRFTTRSDTEVIVHAWEEWQEDCVHRFRGMFAFAIWDETRQTLFAARDRLGEKPFYYTYSRDGLFLFASELGALTAGLGETPALDLEAVEEYFAFGYVPDPKSIFAGVHKLPPAHHLTLRRGKPPAKPVPYWDVTLSSQGGIGGGDEGRVAVELAERLADATRMRMVSDVPIGAFLSGGVDSSGVVAFMAQSSLGPVRTCSMGSPDPVFDEREFALQVANRYATDHREEIVSVDAVGMIDRLARAYSEPFADSSALPTFLVSQLARRHVTVALSGDGGDEVFGGYRRHAFHMKEEAVKAVVPATLRGPLFGALAHFYPKLDRAPRWLRAKATFESLAADAVGGYFRAVTLLPEARRSQLLVRDFDQALGGYRAVEVLRGHAARAGVADPLARALYIDLKTWLPGGMLTKVDRASMANGLEVRAPFVDHELVEWAASLPSALKVRGLEGKFILKKALEPHLPHPVLYRPKKGFSIPMARWMRGALRERLDTLATSPALTGTHFFNRRGLEQMVADHKRGVADHSRILWATMMFEAFLETTRASA